MLNTLYWIQKYRFGCRIVSTKILEQKSDDTYWMSHKPWRRVFMSRHMPWQRYNKEVYYSAIGHAADLGYEVFTNRREATKALSYKLRRINGWRFK